MADKEQDNRVFVGGLSWDVTERQLESAFSRYGKILDCQVMTERDTGRPRGFGFLTFSDRRDMEVAIREMNGRELGDRVISVNKAQPKMGDDSPRPAYGGYSSATGRSSYGSRVGKSASAGPDECFKCGRPGHWARDCPSAGGGARYAPPLSPPPRAKYGGGVGTRGDRYPVDRERYVDDRYDGSRGRFGDKDRYDSRDDRYGPQDRFVGDRYHPPPSDRFPVDRYGAPDRYPANGYGKERPTYDRGEGGPRGGGGGGGGNDRYGAGPMRYEGRSYRERPGPYDRAPPPPRRGGPPPAY